MSNIQIKIKKNDMVFIFDIKDEMFAKYESVKKNEEFLSMTISRKNHWNMESMESILHVNFT